MDRFLKNYRFSEDLDFTLLNNDISNDKLLEWFSEVFDYIKEEVNIPTRKVISYYVIRSKKSWLRSCVR